MGRPKAWLPVGGEPMLARVARITAAAVGPVVVVAAPGQELPPLPAGVEVARDSTAGNGPLEGLAAGLAVLAGRADAAVVTGCDAPFLTSSFVRRLVALREGAPACAVVVGGFPRPLPGVYAVSLLGVIHGLLAERQLRLGALLERVPARLVEPAAFVDVDPALASLRNVNTPDEYARALAELGRPPQGESG
jgi:molybdopterin-guanine dinucleotide biosynthesis protein A